MIQNNHDAIIDKIKKLLALSQSPNKEESERAAEKARELLLKYDLTIDQFEDVQIEEKLIKKFLKKPPLWRLILINTIAEFYFCRFLVLKSVRSDGSIRDYNFEIIGKPHHIAIAISIYGYIENAVIRISRENIRSNAKMKFRESFRYGMAVQISARLKEMKRIRETGGTGEESALIIKEDREVEDFISRKNPGNFTIGKIPNNRSAFERGVDAAKGVALNEQVKNDRYAIGQ